MGVGVDGQGWTAVDNNCDDQEPAISLPHNMGCFSLGFYNLSTRYIQQQHKALWLEYSVSFPSPSSAGGEGKATSSRARVCLHFVT